jgi:hypothetical protein
MTKSRLGRLLACGVSASVFLGACTSTRHASSRATPGSSTRPSTFASTAPDVGGESRIEPRPPTSSESVAGVSLYASEERVRRILGAPQMRTPSGLGERWAYPRGLFVWTAPGLGVIRIDLNAAGPTTDTGIQVGSASDQLPRVYGAQLRLSGLAPTLPAYWFTVTRAHSYWYFFLRDNRVRLIQLTCSCKAATLTNDEGPPRATA